MIWGYARTSTDDQKAGLEDQRTKLQAAGCDRVFVEEASAGEGRDRPKLDTLIGDLLDRDDVLVVTKLDRLARSTSDLLRIVRQLDKLGAALRILDLSGSDTDTRSPMGRLLLTVLSAIAQFERELMLERQRVGIAAAKQEGKYKGRKPTARAKTDDVRRLKAAGIGAAEIARRLKIGRTSVYRALETAA